jgi:dTMP kinase
MPARGKLIAIEGVDGSGKGTQTRLLSEAIMRKRLACVFMSFPRYESFFGKLIAQFLNGEFGPLDTVDPHFAALLYAGDRLDAKPQLAAALDDGKTILCDRYIASNMAHQGSRVPPDKRAEFLEWLKRLEYDMYGLPRENLVVYLRLKPDEAQRMVARKRARSYTSREHDLLESDLRHLEQTSAVYQVLASEPHWVTVDCFDAESDTLKSRDAIHQLVLAAVEPVLLSAQTSGAAKT